VKHAYEIFSENQKERGHMGDPLEGKVQTQGHETIVCLSLHNTELKRTSGGRGCNVLPSVSKIVAMLTCRLFHITYNAIVLSGKKPKAKPASKPAGIA
jgi:hypothetical protein